MFLSKRHAARLELGIASLLIVTGTLASSALSDDFTIDTPTNTTNGGFTLDGDDMLSITEDGSIETSAASGVEATGGHIVVVNDGRIEAEGVGAIGITNFDSDHSTITNNGSISSKSGGIFNAISYGTTVTNNGTITTAGNESFGIVNSLSNNSTVLNAGSIFTSDDGADGINNTGSNNSMVTNSGVISTAGEGADGIFQIISAGTVIVNSGSITTRRFETHGIFYWSSDGAAVTNSGSILVEGENSYGIYNAYLSNNTTVSNSGSIRATAADSTGITVIEAANVSVTNSGFLVSEQGDALFIADSTDSTLNLSAPGYVGGSIHLGPDGTAVNFETGASHSVLWTLDGNITGGDPVISGDVPGFYNASTKQFATYDPSALAGALDEFGDMTRLLSDAGRDALAKSGFWVTGLGGDIEHEGDGTTTLDRDIRQYGVAAGYTGQTAGGATFNVMGGYLRSEQEIRSQWASSYDVESDGWFLGASAERRVGALTVQAGVTGGATATGQQRFVNDNLAETNGLTLGESWADASYDSWFLAPEIGVSATIGDTDGWSMTPAVRLRYANQWSDAFTETGSNADATVDERTLGMFEASAEVAVAKAFSFGSVSTRVGYQTRKSTGDDAATVTLVDATQDVGFGEVDADAAYAALGVALDLGPSAQLGVNVTGFFGEDTLGGQATARLSASF